MIDIALLWTSVDIVTNSVCYTYLGSPSLAFPADNPIRLEVAELHYQAQELADQDGSLCSQWP